MGAVSEYMEKQYGTKLEAVDAAIAINAVAPVVAMPNDPNRFAWVIVNDGAAVAYVGFNSAVGVLNGIQVGANGGVVGFNARDDGEIVTRAVYSIGAGASTLFIVQTRAI